MSEGELLSDKSASSSTGSVQMSVDSTAASTDSITAPSETPSSSSTSGGVKIADIPLPDDRPHTISSAVYQPPMRPPIIPDTFEPPTSGPSSSRVADIYSRPSLVTGKDSRTAAPMAVATPTVPVTSGLLARDDCTGMVSGGAQLFVESSKHSCAEPAVSQKRKTVRKFYVCYFFGLQCFDAVGWAAVRTSNL